MDSQAPIALITGCNSGIGKHLALEFAARGVSVIATARNVASIEELTTKHSNIHALPLELDDLASIDRLRDSVEKLTGGRLDYLVNNAGTHYAATGLDSDVQEAKKLFDVNLFAVMRLCQLFVPMLRRAIAGRGKIVQIGSIARCVPVVWQAVYNASKAALSQYSKTLRLELQPFGIEVIEVVTGFVQSNMLRHGFIAPKSSIYLPLLPIIRKFKVEGNNNGMRGEDYARSVVGQVIGRNTAMEIWEGTLAWKIWTLFSFLPYRLLNLFFYKRFQMDVLKPSP
ncbi:NADPH-dependent 1-acyldihydroxyacetone phosphate reductase [Escovopsis weberi]|uniref:NADPH-dependent 1-acyldihydroxyacetone phosphate reductase n=1 Tax=Escovopsis weberi TaxID=150374 RepID=A0A0M8N0N0_ESCWE|nr:NADPH-dependent 1-acyldihydroxyacetone phosphate reductase [Escovopsis weberi]